MENTPAPTAAAAEASSEAQATSENQQSTQDLIKNLKGEFNRKISKLSEQLQVALSNKTTTVSQPADEAADVDTDVKQYVNTAFTQREQVSALSSAKDLFPELDPDSDQFDEKFYKAVDAEFSTNLRNDPKGPLKAAKLVALEMGKLEQVTRSSLLKDEARRSRILSEGSSTPREAKKDKDPAATFNKAGLARLGINPEKLAKRMKENKEKYSE